VSAKTTVKLLGQLSKFLSSESKQIDKKAEAPSGSPLGRIAFGQERLDKVPFEQDTKVENKLFSKLVAHVENQAMLDSEAVSQIKSMMKKELYPNIFKEPDVDDVYRGMIVTSQWLKKALKIGKGKKIPDKGTLKKSFTYTPKRGWASSWSTAKSVATKFSSKEHSDSSKYKIVMRASVDDNPLTFVDMRKGLYNVSQIDHFKDESEAIGMGKIRVYEVTWVMEDYSY